MSDKKKFDYPLFRRVMRTVTPYKRVFYLTLFLTALLAPMAVLRPKLLQVMVDDYIAPGDIHGMTLLACAIMALLVLEVILRYFFLYHADWLGQATIRDLRVRIFNHVNKLNISYFDKKV